MNNSDQDQKPLFSFNKIFLKAQSFFLFELLILSTFIFIINNYLGNVDDRIHADGIGYYDHLPSAFIHHDLVRKNDHQQDDPDLYSRINTLGEFTYLDHDGHKVNKYPCGTAVLQFPFFYYTLLTIDLDENAQDGYQPAFHKTIFHAALFYLLLSLIFIRLLLTSFNIDPVSIIITQVLLVLSTSITHYTNVDPSYSHIYSLFAITAFMYFARSFFISKKTLPFVLACGLLGLVLILRQVNLLVVLFIPFIAGSVSTLKDGGRNILKRPAMLVLGLILFAAVISIQMSVWYLQSGHWVVYSYQGEGFNFLNPHFWDILFSYKKGLYIYTPILFIATLGTMWFVIRRKWYMFFSWMIPFIILTYILSSWWAWSFGGSFGLRAYIDHYTFFFILFAIVLSKLPNSAKVVVVLLSSLTIPLNIIQTYQYKEYILSWSDMDKTNYWKVFLNTDENFKGLIWKRSYDMDQYYDLVHEEVLGDLGINGQQIIYDRSHTEIPEFDQVSVIRILFENDFKQSNNSKIRLTILSDRPDDIDYYHEPYLLHYHEEELNKRHTGLYNYEFSPYIGGHPKQISITVLPDPEQQQLNNTRIQFFKKKQ